jgi:hypothetical protein
LATELHSQVGLRRQNRRCIKKNGWRRTTPFFKKIGYKKYFVYNLGFGLLFKYCPHGPQ